MPYSIIYVYIVLIQIRGLCVGSGGCLTRISAGCAVWIGSVSRSGGRLLKTLTPTSLPYGVLIQWACGTKSVEPGLFKPFHFTFELTKQIQYREVMTGTQC